MRISEHHHHRQRPGEIISANGEETWGTVGVACNIIDASWQALVDSVEYKLRRDERRGLR